MRLLLVRHGQSTNNAVVARTGSRAQRVPEPVLTDVGVEQTRRLAAALPGALPSPVRVTSSLMTRALQTAAILADALGVPVHTCPDLHEAGGIYDGGPDGLARVAVAAPPLADLLALSPRIVVGDDVPDPWWVGPYERREVRAERAERVVAGLAADAEAAAGTHVVVGHQHFSQDVIRVLLGISSMSGGYLRINNTGTCLFEGLPQACLARWINRTDHLTDDLLTT